MIEGVPMMLMRGGSSKGLVFSADDLPSDTAERDDLPARTQKAVARIAELGWQPQGDNHLCHACARKQQSH